jgi:peptidoglycan/xylan/chitin deacetylase (PgdA/CDA1 family)
MLLMAVLLMAGTSSQPKLAPAPAVADPAVALAAADDLPDVHGAGWPATGQSAAVPRVILGAATTSSVVALTFDLDMNAQMAASARAGTVWVNKDALAYLEARKIHATMFLTGMWAEVYPTLARQLATNANFEIGDHSYSHPAFHTPCYRLGGVSRAAQALQIQLAQHAIQQATGVLPRFFRFPGGCYDRSALDLVHAAGLIPVEWNVNSIDAFNVFPQQIASTVLSQVKPGSIVVMHLHGGANAPATGLALRLIIPALEAHGYRFLTVSELLAAGTVIQPTDSREVVEFYQPPTPTPTPVARLIRPTPRWCGWVNGKHGRVWVCR